MGNSTQSYFAFYALDDHPIDGKSSVFTVEGEGSFVMSRLMDFSPSLQIIMNKIALQEHKNLIKFYGFEEKQGAFSSCERSCLQSKKHLKLAYWEFLNHDLSKEMKKQKRMYSDYFIWGILEGVLDGAILLKKFNIFIEFNTNVIQFGVQMFPKIYWSNVLPNNMHRSYFQFFFRESNHQAFFSPEQLSSMKNGVQNYKMNLQKCSVFSMGMTLLTFFTGFNLMASYNYDKKFLNDNVILESLRNIRQRYGQVLQFILAGMIELQTYKRRSFEQIWKQVNLAKKNQLQVPKEYIKETTINSERSQKNDSFMRLSGSGKKISLKM